MSESTRAAYRIALLGLFISITALALTIMQHAWPNAISELNGMGPLLMFAPVLLWFAGFLYSFVTLPFGRDLSHVGALSLNVVLLSAWVAFLGWHLDSHRNITWG